MVPASMASLNTTCGRTSRATSVAPAAGDAELTVGAAFATTVKALPRAPNELSGLMTSAVRPPVAALALIWTSTESCVQESRRTASTVMPLPSVTDAPLSKDSPVMVSVMDAPCSPLEGATEDTIGRGRPATSFE